MRMPGTRNRGGGGGILRPTPQRVDCRDLALSLGERRMCVYDSKYRLADKAHSLEIYVCRV
jgi:hypothetical protein